MINNVILIGNVGNITQHSGVTKISLATSKSYKNKMGETVKDTQWHHLVFFNRLAEVASQYVQTGDKLYIEGEIKYDKYTDKDGVEKNSTSIIVAKMQMLGSKDGAKVPEASYNPKTKTMQSFGAPASPVNFSKDEIEDDLPF